MKKIGIIIFMFSFFVTYAQDDNESEVLISFNKILPIKFNIYAIPLKIKQVNVKNQINYANPEGILQSFYSANNKEWAISDYLKKPETLVRDQGHLSPWLVKPSVPVVASPDQPTCESKNSNSFIYNFLKIRHLCCFRKLAGEDTIHGYISKSQLQNVPQFCQQNCD